MPASCPRLRLHFVLCVTDGDNVDNPPEITSPKQLAERVAGKAQEELLAIENYVTNSNPDETSQAPAAISRSNRAELAHTEPA